MLTISYKPTFVKQMNKIEHGLAEEALEKIALFKDSKNHNMLKVHKLHGKPSDCFSFSVNYNTRIIFTYETKHEVVLLAIGSHAIYQ